MKFITSHFVGRYRKKLFVPKYIVTSDFHTFGETKLSFTVALSFVLLNITRGGEFVK